MLTPGVVSRNCFMPSSKTVATGAAERATTGAEKCSGRSLEGVRSGSDRQHLQAKIGRENGEGRWSGQ